MSGVSLVLGLSRLAGYVTEPLLGPDHIHAILGEPARIDAAPTALSLKIVSWNIEQGVKYEGVRHALAASNADIYLLQEVDMGVRRSRYREVARDLAHDLGLNWAFAGEFQEIGQGRRKAPALTGQAVLSRFPIQEASTLRFTHQAGLRWRLDPFQPRRGGRVAMCAESAGVILCNAHLESARNDRFRCKQAHEIVAHIGTRHGDRPVVLAGDFNTRNPFEGSPVIRCLTEAGFVDALGPVDETRRTSVNNQRLLDWIFGRNVGETSGRVLDTGNVSDHFPLEATLCFGPGAR